MRIPVVTRVIALSLAIFVASLPAVTATDYERAHLAFVAGDYHRALEHLMIVYTNRQHGPAGPTSGVQAAALHYNLGATYIRLEQYAQAANQFRRIATDPELGALAEFALGYIEAVRGNREEALARFRAAHDSATSKDLRKRAAARLADPLSVSPGDTPQFIAPAVR
jgi:tetratricopeptide (TPR) repeat protein